MLINSGDIITCGMGCYLCIRFSGGWLVYNMLWGDRSGVEYNDIELTSRHLDLDGKDYEVVGNIFIPLENIFGDSDE